MYIKTEIVGATNANAKGLLRQNTLSQLHTGELLYLRDMATDNFPEVIGVYTDHDDSCGFVHPSLAIELRKKYPGWEEFPVTVLEITGGNGHPYGCVISIPVLSKAERSEMLPADNTNMQTASRSNRSAHSPAHNPYVPSSFPSKGDLPLSHRKSSFYPPLAPPPIQQAAKDSPNFSQLTHSPIPSFEDVAVVNAFEVPFHQLRPISRTKFRSDKSKAVALTLCIFLGFLGVHRFYLGKKASGRLYFFTLGLLGIGWLTDILVIVTGHMRDGQQLPVK